MKIAIFIASFVISTGLSALGIMTAYRLKKLEENKYASSLFYNTVFMIAFGFYAIWSHIAFGYLLDDVIPSENTLQNVISIFPLLGVPLLIVGWYLLVQFCVEIIDKRLSQIVVIVYFSTCILAFLFLGYYFKNQLVNNEPVQLFSTFKWLAVLNFLIIVLGVVFFTSGTKKMLIKIPKIDLAFLLISPALLTTIALLMVSSHWIFIVFFILFFFSEFAIAPTYIYFKREEPTPTDVVDFKNFCLKYEISKRELEIINEICRGKTNREIGDSLFITTQTVKDHAHRIYTKTDVKNRVQLINLVNENKKSEPAKDKP